MPLVLTEILPDVDALIALPPPDLARVVLQLAKENRQSSGLVNIQAITGQTAGDASMGRASYPQHRRHAAERAIAMAWSWLAREGLLVAEPGINGANGWHFLSPDAERLRTDDDFESFKHAAAFPKHLLHPAIADSVYAEILRGEFDTAVFKAMRAVEESVRRVGRFAPTDVGTDLMRMAFNPENGRLTDLKLPKPEREALAHLFAGAAGFFKNPQSHRTVNVDPNAARELAIFASLLLRLVDERAHEVRTP